jgi:CRISPR-associated endonuclease Cas3-HD
MVIIPLAHPCQPLLVHSHNVGISTSQLCLFLAAWARLIGLLHDYGKYRPEWVKEINEIDQGNDPGKLPYHSVESALYLMRLFPQKKHFKVNALALLIACHHTGLDDLSDGMDWLMGLNPMS